MRAEFLFAFAVLLSACASEPRPADPPRLKAAYDTEAEAAKRYQRGELAQAERRFAEAMRQFAAIDDEAGRERIRLHLARTRLALGRATAALELLDGAPDTDVQQVEVDMLRAQAHLALRHTEQARAAVERAASRCAPACPEVAGIQLLRGRVALAAGRGGEAQVAAAAALKLLREEVDPLETGNAWRLSAAAQLAAGDPGAALAGAQAALAIDRRLALPEKIARDWLLLGDIHRALARAGNAGAAEAAAAAYRHAAEVASAAGLAEISLTANKSFDDMGIKKN